MQLLLRDNLPFVTVSISHNGKSIEISNVLVDTGSGGTIFAADIMSAVGIEKKFLTQLYCVKTGGTIC
ncbi:MAG: hypothetical protein IT314_09465 [Anaerolineales bacterium]|nr:hypothetical protein [Anaerolineales bacterium]